jgi:hypothetical protein
MGHNNLHERENHNSKQSITLNPGA